MEYKISQKPYPQNGYNMDYIRAANAFNNPWAGLGALLGAVLTKNYVDRGERKLMDSMKDSIPTNNSQETEAQALQKMLENRPSQEETAKQTIFDAYKNGNNTPIEPNYEIGLERLKNQTTDPLEVAALQSAINQAQPQEAESGKVTPNEINALNKYINENMPHMDAQGNLSNMDAAANLQAQKAQAQPQGIPKFSTDEWEAKMWQEGKRQGRPDYQIQAVIDRMKPQALQAEKRYNDAQADYWGNEFLANMPLDNGVGGDSAARLNAITQLYQYDPEKAKILASGNISPRETASLNNQRAQTAQKAQQTAFNNALKLAKASGGTDYGGFKMSTELKNKMNDIDVAVATGVISEEEGNKRKSAILGNVGKTSGQLKEDNELADFDNTLTGYIESLHGQLTNGDIPGSGETLDAISTAIDENPKLWAKLTDEQKAYVQNFRYLANRNRQILAGYDDWKKFDDAITPQWKEKFANMGLLIDRPNHNGQVKS